MSFTITKPVFDAIILGAKAVLEEYLPMLYEKYLKIYEESGRMPTEEQIKDMLKDIKKPEDYDTLYPRRREK